MRQGEDRQDESSGPRARRADRRPEDPEDDRRDDGRRRDGQNPGHEDLPEHGPLDVLAAERGERDGRHGADLAVSGRNGLLLDRRLTTDSRRRIDRGRVDTVRSRATCDRHERRRRRKQDAAHVAMTTLASSENLRCIERRLWKSTVAIFEPTVQDHARSRATRRQQHEEAADGHDPDLRLRLVAPVEAGRWSAFLSSSKLQLSILSSALPQIRAARAWRHRARGQRRS